MSSRGFLRLGCGLRPGGCLVVEGAGFEAAVEDAGEPVGELAEGGVVAGAAGALMVVAGADLPRTFRTADLWLIHAADCCSRYSLWTCWGVRY